MVSEMEQSQSSVLYLLMSPSSSSGYVQTVPWSHRWPWLNSVGHKAKQKDMDMDGKGTCQDKWGLAGVRGEERYGDDNNQNALSTYHILYTMEGERKQESN